MSKVVELVDNYIADTILFKAFEDELEKIASVGTVWEDMSGNKYMEVSKSKTKSALLGVAGGVGSAITDVATTAAFNKFTVKDKTALMNANRELFRKALPATALGYSGLGIGLMLAKNRMATKKAKKYKYQPITADIARRMHLRKIS